MLANITGKIFVPLSVLETNSELSVYEKYVFQFERTSQHILASWMFVPPPPPPDPRSPRAAEFSDPVNVSDVGGVLFLLLPHFLMVKQK